MEKTGLKEVLKVFSFDYNAIDTNNILDMHRYLMKETWKRFGFIKKMFVGLLSICTIGSFGKSLASNLKGPIAYVSLNNQSCQTRPTLVNINSDETLFYPFAVSVNKCNGSFNTIDHPYAQGCVRNKVKNANVKVFKNYGKIV